MCLAVPGCILSASGADFSRVGRVDFGGIVREISLAFTPEADVGDYVLVHVGVAIALIDEEEAGRIFDALEELDEMIEDMP